MSRTPFAPALHSGAVALRRRLPLSHRSGETELLDAPEVDPVELSANLTDLTRVNRLPGGSIASLAAIERLTDAAPRLCILDVGTGAGDMPMVFVAHARARGARWEVRALDSRPDVLAHAASRTSAQAEITLLLGDAARLPLGDGSVDIAHASLVLHHLDPADAVACLAEMRRVARRGVVVNDLRRGIGAFLMAAPVVLAFGRSAMTKHDGIASLRRAYTLGELDDLLAAAGLRPVWRSNRLLPRIVTAAVAA